MRPSGSFGRRMRVASMRADVQGRRDEMGEDLTARIRAIVAEQLGVEPDEVNPHANILDDLGADSLDVVEMVMTLEEAFDIEVPDEDVEQMRTVGDVETYVVKAVGVGA
jgi:acyl carrier protein